MDIITKTIFDIIETNYEDVDNFLEKFSDEQLYSIAMIWGSMCPAADDRYSILETIHRLRSAELYLFAHNDFWINDFLADININYSQELMNKFLKWHSEQIFFILSMVDTEYFDTFNVHEQDDEE